MTTIEEMLNNRRNEINAEIVRLQEELAKVGTALSHLTGTPVEEVKLTREEAIIEAVRQGHTRPKTIDRFIRTNMKMKLNVGSLRSTLSRLKTEGKIKHDDSGWIM